MLKLATNLAGTIDPTPKLCDIQSPNTIRVKTKRKDMKEVVRLLSHNGTLITVQYLTGFNISGFTAGHPPALDEDLPCSTEH